ncbi:MAG TPA: GTPase HflX [Planctomycetes bacterium]|nr:GTPase HflX [Planctomycetota bacterium]
MTNVIGKTFGLKASELAALKRLARRRVRPEDALSVELAREMAELSAELGARIGVLLDRGGRVCCVSVGDAREMPLPPDARGDATNLRLSGLRLVHTAQSGAAGHAAGEFARADLVDLLRRRLDLSLRINVSPEGIVESVTRAAIEPPNRAGTAFRVEIIRSLNDLLGTFARDTAALEEELARLRPRARDLAPRERAILVGVWHGDRGAAERSMAELAALAESSGAEVVDTVMQRRFRPDPRSFIGHGKVWELSVLALHRAADVIIFNHELGPGMARNLEDELPVKLIDRTQLILDIFAQRASSAEGKLEVELARLVHALPRLRTDGERMGQIRGGIGSDRGVGEPQKELNRRTIKRRIAQIEERLAHISAQRAELRKRREKNTIPVAALVGYTNAGKTTLLNRLTAADSPAGPQLFMTLESTSRRFVLPSGRRTIIVDTVGFIRDLPPGLMRAFEATLEELRGADVLLHIADAGDRDVFRHIEVVEEVLGEIGLGDRPRILVFNKIDRVDLGAFKPLCGGRPAEFVSALAPDLRARIGELLDGVLPGAPEARRAAPRESKSLLEE